MPVPRLIVRSFLVAGLAAGLVAAAQPAAAALSAAGKPYSVKKTEPCLADEDWILIPEETRIEATSPGGLPLVVDFYPSAAKAKAKAKAKKKGQVVIGNVVITFQSIGREQFTGKATKQQVNQAVATLKKCLH